MISQCMTSAFKKEVLEGVHDLTTDTLKLALYQATADLGADTLVYTTVGETTGGGYAAGGETVANVTVGLEGTTAVVDFDDVVWATSGFTTRGALLYNSSKANRAIAVLDFGADKTPTGVFTVSLPPATAAAALLRIV